MRNVVLIILGVTFLIWLSTLGDNEVRSKMEFYSGTAGTFVALGVFMLPLILAFKLMFSGIGERELRNVKVQVTVGAIMIASQLVIIAFIPNIINLYTDVGETISDVVIRAKG
jgi:uncharacterized membrane protein